MNAPERSTIDKSELEALIRLLHGDGYRVIGPTIRDGAIVYDEIAGSRDLPIGWEDVQSAGSYRLARCADDAWFNHVVGPHSLKKYMFPPRMRLVTLTQSGRELPALHVENTPPSAPRCAFIGVRACELAALSVQDRVFAAEAPDPYYVAARRAAFIVAVNCTRPGGTCFCASMETGPECRSGFDLALTELPGAFVVQVGSPRGREVFERLQGRATSATEGRLAELLVHNAAERMGRRLDTAELPEILQSSAEHPHWERIANRCLACANCTMVCPTCFCSSIEDGGDLTGARAERTRSWGSCFTLEFSYHTGGYGRSSLRARYRHWLTHKLATWHEQFGCSGCVGCGRCITWCPVGIDITAEARAIAADVRRSRAADAAEALAAEEAAS